jgi:tetratricopeptide (TPR) repeat protein
MTRSLASVSLLFAFSTCLFAQMDCDLMVRIRTPEERTIEAPIQIEVLSPEGFVIATSNTMGGETADFNISSGKTYRLRVSGPRIDAITTPSFSISPMESSHTETVHVKSDTRNQGEASTPGATTVSVSELVVPNNAGAEMKKGLGDYYKGDMEKAAAHFEKAAADYPKYARAYDMLGVIAIKQPDRPKARELFSKSIQVDDSFFPAYMDLARMEVQDRQYAQAETLLQKAIVLNPSMPDAEALLATAEFANKEYDKALAAVQRTHALPHHEQFAEVHLMAARVFKMQNHPDEAIAQYQLFLKEKPDSPEVPNARKALASLQASKQH